MADRRVRSALGRWGVGAALVCCGAALSQAATLTDRLEHETVGLFEDVGPALAAAVATAASTYPVASASASVRYVYEPSLGTFVRRATLARPILGERAETVGRHHLDVAMTYSYVHFTTIDGHDLDDLEGRLPLSAGVEGGVIQVPVFGDLDVDAHIVATGFTYGVTPDLDVNATVPFVRTSLEVLAGAGRNLGFAGSAEGVGDVLLRAKYVLVRDGPVGLAGSLTLGLPTGSRGDLHGSGDVHLRPLLIVSRVLADRVEPLLNAGLDLDTENLAGSAAIWAAGVIVGITAPLATSIVFLGRHDLEAPTDTDTETSPFFFELRRNDVVDASLGVHLRLAELGFVTAGAIFPLNRDGLRPDVVPNLAIELTF